VVYHDYLLCHDVPDYAAYHTNLPESAEDKNNAVAIFCCQKMLRNPQI
jgi:hypothetical protein